MNLAGVKRLLNDIARHNAAALSSRPPPSPAGGDRRASARPSDDTPPGYIMLVEDNPDTSALVTEILVEDGYAVRAFMHGGEAFDFLSQDFLESQRTALDRKLQRFVRGDDDDDGPITPVLPRVPSLVLLDLMLPVKNGRELYRIMKEREHLRHVPIVVMSTESRITKLRDDLVNIADILSPEHEELPKPFESSQLLEFVHRLVGPAPRRRP